MNCPSQKMGHKYQSGSPKIYAHHLTFVITVSTKYAATQIQD